MKRYENLLITASEDGAQLQHAISKALRFGLDNHHPETDTKNAEKIVEEYYKLSAIVMHLQGYGYLPEFSDVKITEIMQDEIEKVTVWQRTSEKKGILEGKLIPLDKK